MKMFISVRAIILLATIVGSMAYPYTYDTSTNPASDPPISPAPTPGQTSNPPVTPVPSPGQTSYPPVAPTPAPSGCCPCESASPSPSPISFETCALDCGEEDSGTLSGLEDADIYGTRFLRDVVPEQEHRELGACIRTPFAGGRVRFIGCNTANIALIPEDSDGVFGTGWTHTVGPGTGPTYFDVDGFCIKGKPLTWVKIGDHCDVTFTCAGGGVTYERCCNWCASLIKGVPSVQTQKAGAWPHCDAIPGWPNAAGGINP